jgi:hypothetical protein
MMAMAATEPTTAPAIQAFEVEPEGGLALGCEEDVPVAGEVLVAGEKLLDCAGDGEEPDEGVIVVATVATRCKSYHLASL